MPRFLTQFGASLAAVLLYTFVIVGVDLTLQFAFHVGEPIAAAGGVAAWYGVRHLIAKRLRQER